MGTSLFNGTASGFKVYYHVSQAASWDSFNTYPKSPYIVLTLDPNYDGGTALTINLEFYGSSLISYPSSVPTRTGYAFNGWYKDTACTDDWDFAADIISGDLALYTGWITGTAPGSLNISAVTASADFGRTIITLGSAAGPANTLVYKVSDLPAVNGLTTASTVTDGAAFISGSTSIPVTAGQYVTIYEITPASNIVNYVYRQIAASEICATVDGVIYVLSGGTLTIDGYNGPGGAVIIPDNINGYPVTAMKEGASSSSGVFSGKTNITSVTLPDSVTNIGAYAFYGCNNAGFTSFTIPTDVTSIGNEAFRGCTALTSAMLKSGITYGTNVYYGCTGLTSVTIEDGVTAIPAGAFYGCTGLNPNNFTIPASVTSIGNQAFSGCTNAGFTSFTIPASVTSFGIEAFRGCTALTSATLKSGVTYGDGVITAVPV